MLGQSIQDLMKCGDGCAGLGQGVEGRDSQGCGGAGEMDAGGVMDSFELGRGRDLLWYERFPGGP